MTTEVYEYMKFIAVLCGCCYFVGTGLGGLVVMIMWLVEGIRKLCHRIKAMRMAKA